MTDGDSVAQLAVVVLLLILAVPTLATAYDYAGTPHAFSEDVTVDYSDETQVSATATVEGYGDDPTITADGQTLNETAYDWDSDAGTITWSNTSATSDGQQATIEYRAYQRTGETELSWTIIGPLMGLFGLFALVASIRTLWSYIAEVWSL